MTTEQISQDDIRNLHVSKVHDRLNAKYAPSIMQEIAAAHHRHRNQGTDARNEAATLNKMFGLTS